MLPRIRTGFNELVISQTFAATEVLQKTLIWRYCMRFAIPKRIIAQYYSRK